MMKNSLFLFGNNFEIVSLIWTINGSKLWNQITQSNLIFVTLGIICIFKYWKKNDYCAYTPANHCVMTFGGLKVKCVEKLTLA